MFVQSQRIQPEQGLYISEPPAVRMTKRENVEQVGHLNLGSALHPVVMKDGRVMFAITSRRGF